VPDFSRGTSRTELSIDTVSSTHMLIDLSLILVAEVSTRAGGSNTKEEEETVATFVESYS